jgi:hypothetical protein
VYTSSLMRIENGVFINMIENRQDIPLTLQDKAALVLGHERVKPTATLCFSFSLHDATDAKRFAWQRRLSIVDGLLSTGQLSYRLLDKVGEDAILYITFQVGKDNQTLQRLILAKNHNGGSEGFVLGYPKTAVRAFKDRNTISESELPTEVQDSDYIRFLLFKLSRNHWQKELKTVKGWARVIRQVAPKLYQAILDQPKPIEF